MNPDTQARIDKLRLELDAIQAASDGITHSTSVAENVASAESILSCTHRAQQALLDLSNALSVDYRDPRDSRDPRDQQDPRYPRDPRDPRDPRYTTPTNPTEATRRRTN